MPRERRIHVPQPASPLLKIPKKPIAEKKEELQASNMILKHGALGID